MDQITNLKLYQVIVWHREEWKQWSPDICHDREPDDDGGHPPFFLGALSAISFIASTAV